jgi:amylosucrase
VALLNDYSYRDVPEHAHDSRWVHRPRMDWQAARTGDAPSARVYQGVKHILGRRAATDALHAGHATRIIRHGQPGLFAFARLAPTGAVVCLFNFTESWLNVPEALVRGAGARVMHDALSDNAVHLHAGAVVLPPYGRVWLT